MLGISHLLISGTASSLLLQTADPVLIAVGAIGGLLPDVDVSTHIPHPNCHRGKLLIKNREGRIKTDI
jgi:hypothetical protein